MSLEKYSKREYIVLGINCLELYKATRTIERERERESMGLGSGGEHKDIKEGRGGEEDEGEED